MSQPHLAQVISMLISLSSNSWSIRIRASGGPALIGGSGRYLPDGNVAFAGRRDASEVREDLTELSEVRLQLRGIQTCVTSSSWRARIVPVTGARSRTSFATRVGIAGAGSRAPEETIACVWCLRGWSMPTHHLAQRKVDCDALPERACAAAARGGGSAAHVRRKPKRRRSGAVPLS